jgi:uncharacterized protein (DUF1684 family)
MKRLFLLLLLSPVQFSFAQADSVTTGILKFQQELTTEYRNPKTSPLKGKAVKRFKSHEFFAIDLNYRVEATITVTPESTFFPMQTSSQVLKEHRIYGTLSFALKGKQFVVPVYQSKTLLKNDLYKDYLFFPFTDLTSGTKTYGAGRYVDLRIPKEGNTLILDFNKAYNPYCAYSDDYSCPLVPKENNLDIEILAGIKYSEKKKH